MHNISDSALEQMQVGGPVCSFTHRMTKSVAVVRMTFENAASRSITMTSSTQHAYAAVALPVFPMYTWNEAASGSEAKVVVTCDHPALSGCRLLKSAPVGKCDPPLNTSRDQSILINVG